MKAFRFLLLLAVCLLSLSLCGCGTKAAAQPTPAATPVPTEAPAVTPVPEQILEPTPEPAPAPTPEPVYDQAAYDAALDALLKEYQILRITEPGEFREEEHPEIPWYSIVSYLNFQYDGVNLYHGLYDFDGNGVPELVMATGDEGYKYPIGIYAFDGEKLLYLCKEQALGERASVGLNADGSFTVHGSGGAASGGVIVYRIGEDGYSTDIQQWYEYAYQPDGSVQISPIVGEMTPEFFDPEALYPPFDAPIQYELVP